ncbi:tRNA (guanosine(46)-N7)-methyltransferase TrmB [Agilicoccus flavus]|uniref:tRNA (guanosine(46)-N7)-methyltransferase TrmB n=1 Tax=Agilicoccus flavus TaxID=2775968 RepID=UPI001CF6E16A|nr:tRNA (guanosine(46)-N7)-methyltransferase TrmB [Agilicoccus flavus]
MPARSCSAPTQDAPAGGLLRREVVSFARRDGRASRQVTRAFEPPYARLVVAPARAERSTSLHPDWRLDAAAEFGRSAPLVIEIGSGTGESVLACAAAHPDVDHLAVEVYRPGAARTVLGAHRLGVGNVRVLEADARALLAAALPSGSVDEIRIFFPDPWPKARHHKRRLVQADTVADCARALRRGGHLRLATDWADYAEHMRAAIASCPLLGPASGGRGDADAPRFSDRPLTRYERKALEAGRTVVDLDVVRR